MSISAVPLLLSLDPRLRLWARKALGVLPHHLRIGQHLGEKVDVTWRKLAEGNSGGSGQHRNSHGAYLTCCTRVPDIDRTAPLAVRVSAPDGDGPTPACRQLTGGIRCGNDVLAQHVSELAVRRQANIRRGPGDPETGNRQARLNVRA